MSFAQPRGVQPGVSVALARPEVELKMDAVRVVRLREVEDKDKDKDWLELVAVTEDGIEMPKVVALELETEFLELDMLGGPPLRSVVF